MGNWVKRYNAPNDEVSLVNVDMLEEVRVAQVGTASFVVAGFRVMSDSYVRLSPLYGDRRSAEIHLAEITGATVTLS